VSFFAWYLVSFRTFHSLELLLICSFRFMISKRVTPCELICFRWDRLYIYIAEYIGIWIGSNTFYHRIKVGSTQGVIYHHAVYLFKGNFWKIIAIKTLCLKTAKQICLWNLLGRIVMWWIISIRQIFPMTLTLIAQIETLNTFF
jgi:hypothetical protein